MRERDQIDGAQDKEKGFWRMIIEVSFVNGPDEYYDDVWNYDFYPETKMLFINRKNKTSTFVPITKQVKAIHIVDGTERGYLEGRDETC